jgi:cyanophycin synthetase
MFTVKRSPVDVVLPTGTAVLKADEKLVADMAPLSAGSVTFFALDGAHPVIAEHRAAGKRAVFVRGEQIVLAEGPTETALAKVSEVPLTCGGTAPFQVENALAAIGAAWAMGLTIEQLRSGVASFRGDVSDSPGRFNLFTSRGATVIVDDCHNASALAALAAALDRLGAGRRTAVYSAGALRRDGDIVWQGELLAQAFDKVILYDDVSASERAPGEIPALLRRGLEKGGRVKEVEEIRGHRQAIDAALSSVKEGELAVVQTEDNGVEPTLAIVRTWASQREAALGGAGVESPRAAAAGAGEK